MEKVSVPEQLRCPICFELPPKEVYQCRNGHVLCGPCSLKMRQCPTCRVSFREGKVRNRVMESLLETYKVDCPNKESIGCSVQLFPENMGEHLDNCNSNANRINFCGHIGYTCGHTIDLRNLQRSLDHFIQTHGFIAHKGAAVTLNLEDFKVKSSVNTKQHSSLWTPVLISVDDAKIVILSLFDENTKMVSWMGFLLENSSPQNSYSLEFLIKDNSNESGHQELSWKIPVMQISNCPDFLDDSPFQIPTSLLMKHYVTPTESIKVDVKIKRDSSASGSTGSDLNLNTLSLFLFHAPRQTKPKSDIANSSSGNNDINGSLSFVTLPRTSFNITGRDFAHIAIAVFIVTLIILTLKLVVIVGAYVGLYGKEIGVIIAVSLVGKGIPTGYKIVIAWVLYSFLL